MKPEKSVWTGRALWTGVWGSSGFCKSSGLHDVQSSAGGPRGVSQLAETNSLVCSGAFTPSTLLLHEMNDTCVRKSHSAQRKHHKCDHTLTAPKTNEQRSFSLGNMKMDKTDNS